jgi:CubicO group peptidase (beta-lactamase class C family)
MSYLVIFLQVLFLGTHQPKPTVQKPLEKTSIYEINAIFKEVNQQFKWEQANDELSKIAKVINGSILFISNDSVMYEYTGGYKSLTAKKNISNKISETTLFDLASISKQFTAAAILKLVEHDSLSLEDYLIDYFPDLPYNTIKIKHLLTHTSGLPEYLDFEQFFRTDTIFTNQMLLQYLTCDIPIMTATPGVEFKYTNTNYALLASIIEQITGQSFPDYVRANLLIPAGMTHTFFYTELKNGIQAEVCKGHLIDGEEVPDNILNSVLGDKSMYSTAEDLNKWFQAYFIDNKIISKRYVHQAISPHNQINGVIPSEAYGYGLRIEVNETTGNLVYHGGLWRGFHHVMTYRPKDKLFLLFLSNYRNRSHNGKTKIILRIIDGA